MGHGGGHGDHDEGPRGPIDTNLIWGGLGALLVAWVGAWATVIGVLVALAWLGIFFK